MYIEIKTSNELACFKNFQVHHPLLFKCNVLKALTTL